MMTYALIGCGRIATNHIKAALHNSLKIAAICDIVPAHMEDILARHGLESDEMILRFTDYKKMLEHVKPNLVAIATESGSHAQIALNCIDAGCNIIIEKPMALSISDADKIIERAKSTNVKVCACHQNRFNKAIQHVRKALESGRFGKLSHGTVHVRWNRNKEYYEQSPWRGTWAQDGGALMNQSIHGLDLLRWMMGDEIDEVFAYTAQRFHEYLECEDIGLAVIKFKNGAIGTIEGTTNVFPKNLEETLYLFGETGTVKIGGKSTNTIENWLFASDSSGDAELAAGLIEETSNVYGNGHTLLYADMLAAIENNRKPYIDAQAGKRALELVLAIYKSAATGIPVKFPLDDCASVNMVDMFRK